ncbi:PEP-CTERM sorting domain-containing protein [Massilia sp. P8910]|uniref:PEP-CTERM sorting domain-containing protein n=1 Tax=Massilia antarctica TaxID=2765360 RepID=UPI001E2E4274|nr:PEP-CTERM sorting domain-containing protein [Massilia antarctica]MCE3608172.1 PEP-CTERM sorting domain-containing protein [Massilia antarctica]
MKSYIASLVLGLLAASNSNAELVTFDYTAKVRLASHYTNHGSAMASLQSVSFNGTRIDIGNTVRGSFTLDLDTPVSMYAPDQGPGSTYIEYGNPNGGASKNLMTMRIDQSGYTFAPTPDGRDVRIAIEDGDVGHYDYFIFTNTMHDLDSGRSETIRLDLSQENGTLLSSTRLPSTLNLSRIESAHLTYNLQGAGNSEGYTINSDLTSLSVRTTSPVPEPSTHAMLALGLLTVGAVSRRKRRGSTAALGA